MTAIERPMDGDVILDLELDGDSGIGRCRDALPGTPEGVVGII